METPVEIALVGCGQIAQTSYLPAFALTPHVRCRWLVDLRKDLAGHLAHRWNIPAATDEYRTALEDVEAVILAVPNHLHAPMAREALTRGKAVLCEKPLGRSAEEIRTIVEASERTGAPVVAGMIFRQYPALQAMSRRVPWDALGTVREVRAAYGVPLDWPMSSSHLFDRKQAGGGVLLDIGIHAIDVLFWFLAAERISVTRYVDDGASGVEAEARAQLTLTLPDGRGQVPCRLEASHLRRLENGLEVIGERGTLSIPFSPTENPGWRAGGRVQPVLERPVTPRSVVRCFAEQLGAFAGKVRGNDTECASGASQIPVLELVESCYRARKPLTAPWETYEAWEVEA